MPKTYSAVIAAAGSSSRFGANKLHEKVGGKAVLSHSLDVFDQDADCEEIIVVVSSKVREWIEGNPLVFSGPKLRLADGGDSRAESVAAGARSASAAYLAIHDAARPNFTEALVQKLLAAARPGQGCVPALPVADSIAYATEGLLSSYPERSGLHAVQTPQVFERASYLQALDSAGPALAGYTDDASLYLAAGFSVATVPGLPGNIKLTTADDMQLLLKLMGGGERKSKDKYGGLGW